MCIFYGDAPIVSYHLVYEFVQTDFPMTYLVVGFFIKNGIVISIEVYL